ncbi:MAG: aldo/keto reductase [Anaerovoracaceae bacterium]
MIYTEFKGLKLSQLGFGAMRLPCLEDGSIDEKQVREMVDYAFKKGVNYFDTAYPYHGGMSEIVLGKALSRYPRESFYLADKYPGHQISDSYNPAEIFEEQLEKCGVEYFDFYLIHNVYENSIKTYTDPRWGIVEYFVEQKKQGRIRHLGFSTHGSIAVMEEFLDLYGEHMEFCQIQMNYLDWTLQDAKGKYEMLTERGIPVWVMEPVRGGQLSKIGEVGEASLKELRPDESATAWALRWLQSLPNVKMILSGVSKLEHTVENINTFEEPKPLNEEETNALYRIAEGMHDSIPCTACRYCCDSCPMGIDIPMMLNAYNEIRFAPSVNVSMRIEALEDDRKPSACLSCGACEKMCPQHIEIPKLLGEFAEKLEKMPKWSDISREREEAAKKLKSGK